MQTIETIKLLKKKLKLQKFKEVISECKEILNKNPNNTFILNLCGMAFQKTQIKESVSYFLKAIEIDKNNLAAMNNLANSYKSLNKIDLAEQLYLKINKIDPNYIQAIYNYGNLKHQINDYKKAINIYEKALKLDNKNLRILFSLVDVHQSVGNFNKTKKFLKKIIVIDKNNAAAHKLMSNLLTYKKASDKHIKLMEKLIINKNLMDEEKIDLNFALGKAYEDLGNFKKSFTYLEQGNLLKKNKINFNIEKENNFFGSIKEIFNEIDFRKIDLKNNYNKQEIIFICGMPRSGTTLIEQIVASHKDVTGAGELLYLQQAVENNFIENQLLSKSKIVNEINNNLNSINVNYFNKLKYSNYKTKKITDKAPHNFRWIGLMKIFFPNCKVIHCTRDPKDTCLSIYKNNFSSYMMNWSYDQKDIASYYNLYFDLMNFWEKKLGNFIYEANYEKIVNNQEKEIKKLINFCELKWDPNCLKFFKKNKTPINTASVTQARKAIYKSSLNSNAEYSQYLNKLFSSLELSL